MAGWHLALVVVAACSFHAEPGNAVDDGRGADTRAADAPSGSDACTFSPHVDVCALAGGSAVGSGSGLEIDMDNTQFDTGALTFNMPVIGSYTAYAGVPQLDGSNTVTVLVVDHLVIDGGKHLLPIGSAALVVYATSSIDVNGFIDVTGNPMMNMQAAGGGCPVGDPGNGGSGISEATAGNSGGGGGGGAFGGNGGQGGDSDNSGAGQPGMQESTPPAAPDHIRGGCDGGSGGDGAAATVAGGGAGGGAIELVTPGTITIEDGAGIFAGGGGGQPGGTPTAQGGGAGGGGAGGYIGLCAGVVTLGMAVLEANGGGGGGGALGGGAQPGQPGQPSAMPAAGGNSANGAASGGSGGATATATSAPGMTPADSVAAGGAGGGGGTGVILLRGTVSGGSAATLSPEPFPI